MAGFLRQLSWSSTEEDPEKVSTKLANKGDEFAQANKVHDFLAKIAAEAPNAPAAAKSEGTARRFLVARDWDVGAAVEQLTAHLAFRAGRFPIPKSAFIDDANVKAGAIFPYGHDREGRRIIVVRSGRFQVKDRDLDANVAMVLFQIEHIMHEENDDGSKRFVIVYDRTGFSIAKNYDKPLIKAIGALMSANYPERLEKCFMYPCGVILRGLFEVCKYFLDPKTRTKVCMLGSPEAFLPYIDADQLPSTLGGKATFGDDEVAAFYAELPDRVPDFWQQQEQGGGGGGGGDSSSSMEANSAMDAEPTPAAADAPAGDPYAGMTAAQKKAAKKKAKRARAKANKKKKAAAAVTASTDGGP